MLIRWWPVTSKPVFVAVLMKTTLFFYRVTGTRVEILHILNGAQDHEPILFPQE